MQFLQIVSVLYDYADVFKSNLNKYPLDTLIESNVTQIYAGILPLYSHTGGLMLIYSLLIKNGWRIISSTVLFSPVDRLFKMANNTVMRGGYIKYN